MTKETFLKKPGTKSVYELTETKTETITEDQYNKIINFRNFGGSCTQQKTYTCAGYKVYKDILTSPDKQTKTIMEFEFNYQF